MEKGLKIIVSYDTAIDHARACVPGNGGKSPLDVYIETRDLAIIQPFIIPAETPTYFNIKPLSRALARRIARAQINEFDSHTLSFQYGVTSVENHVDDSGQLIPLWKPTGVVGEQSLVTDEELDLFSLGQVREIGSVIYQLSFLDHKSCKKLQLPLGSRERLAAIQGL